MATRDITDLEVVAAYRDVEFGQFATSLLAERTGQPVKVCYQACERALSRGLIECGVSLRSGWLTPAGIRLLEERKG